MALLLCRTAPLYWTCFYDGCMLALVLYKEHSQSIHMILPIKRLLEERNGTCYPLKLSIQSTNIWMFCHTNKTIFYQITWNPRHLLQFARSLSTFLSTKHSFCDQIQLQNHKQELGYTNKIQTIIVKLNELKCKWWMPSSVGTLPKFCL